MELIKNQNLYLALLQKGDLVRFSVGSYALCADTKNEIVHTGVFAGFVFSEENTCLSFEHVDGEKLTIQTNSAVFYEGGIALEQMLRERSANVTPRYVAFVRNMQRLIDTQQHANQYTDADTVLADSHKNTETKVLDIAEEILGIWEASCDKASIEKLFHAIYGITLLEYLVNAIHVMIQNPRDTQ